MNRPSDDSCHALREHLLELDEGAELAPEHGEHVAGCDDCSALYLSLVEVDSGLAALGPIEAPPELVARALARIEMPDAEAKLEAPPTPTLVSILGGSLGVVFGGFGRLLATLFWPLRNLRRRPAASAWLLVSGAATAAALLTVTTFLQTGDSHEAQVAQVSLEDSTFTWQYSEDEGRVEATNGQASAESALGETAAGDMAELQAQMMALGYVTGSSLEHGEGEELDLEDGRFQYRSQLAPLGDDLPSNEPREQVALELVQTGSGGLSPRSGLEQNAAANFETASATTRGATTRGTTPPAADPAPSGYRRGESTGGRHFWADDEESTRHTRRQLNRASMRERSNATETSGQVLRPADQAATAEEHDRRAENERTTPAAQDGWSQDQGGLEGELVGRDRVRNRLDNGAVVGNASTASVDLDGDVSILLAGQHRVTMARQRAEGLFVERERVSGLSFQEARGHWSNSYVPGDPAARTLHQRLVASGAPLGTSGATGLELAAAAQSFAQPFDAPRHAALAVTVHGDQRSAEGERRMLVQVGLRGAERRSGTRPAMNVGVVLDLSRPLGGDDEARVRALLEAIGEAREIGDRISLTVAGPAGGTLIESGAFRHGQVQVALAQLFADAERATPGAALGLDDAVRAALASVGASDDPTAPLGSSFLLVVTPGLGTSQLSTSQGLERVVHVGAVAGIPTSVVGLGGAGLVPLDRLALAGQGRRRTLSEASEAASIVRDELGAVSQVVARAVRLRIRLAPGTRLVNVLGSRRLDGAATARVRRAERSIDQRLARSLGIEADREEDDDGITIFIPAFYAGDSHVVLLDVVASGPGPVAEVTARYKDLVRLRNGEARGSLRLGRGRRTRGPLQRAVLKNYLGHELSQALGRASRLVRGGDTTRARATLSEFVELAEGVRLLVPELAADRELAADLRLAARYDAALMTLTPQQHAAASDSLRLASRRKTFEPMFSR